MYLFKTCCIQFKNEISGTQNRGQAPWFDDAADIFLNTSYFSIYVRPVPFALIFGQAEELRRERETLFKEASDLVRDYRKMSRKTIAINTFKSFKLVKKEKILVIILNFIALYGSAHMKTSVKVSDMYTKPVELFKLWVRDLKNEIVISFVELALPLVSFKISIHAHFGDFLKPILCHTAKKVHTKFYDIVSFHRICLMSKLCFEYSPVQVEEVIGGTEKPREVLNLIENQPPPTKRPRLDGYVNENSNVDKITIELEKISHSDRVTINLIPL